MVTSAARPARRPLPLPPGWARVGVALVALALVVLGAAPASAHAELIDTDPAEGSVVETAPDTVTLTFNEPVRLTSQEIAVYDAAGDEVGSTAGASGTEVTVALTGAAGYAYRCRPRCGGGPGRGRAQDPQPAAARRT